MKSWRKRKQRGFTLAELLGTVTVLVILLAIGIPLVLMIQRNLRQKELDEKAEIIYTSVQNKLSKMKAGGNTEIYEYSDGSNFVYKLEGIPGDADADDDSIQPGDICYITSESLEASSAAATVIMDKDTVEASLRSHHWVIEYNPASAIVYSVFYSEDKADCAKEYADADEFERYDLWLRFKENRLKEGAKVGYYGGGTASSGSRVTNMSPTLTITNAEKLQADISCTLPAAVSDYPVFKVELTDTTGHTYIKYYAYWQSSPAYMEKIKKEAGSWEVDNQFTSMQKTGRTFTLSLTLDDLSNEKTRFVYAYGKKSDNQVKLDSGTPLKVTVTAMCPGNYKITQNLSDTKVTNSLFADANSKDEASDEKNPKLNVQYGTEEYPAVIHYGRHLQNLEESSGVVKTVKYAQQSSDITFSDHPNLSGLDDWYETYSNGFVYGRTNGVPNFKPIMNKNLVFYNGASETKAYRIVNLTVDASADTSADAGLFAELGDKQTVKNVVLTGTRVKAADNKAAGALVGRVKGNVTMEHCQVFLTASNIQGKSNRDVWISGGTAGGLIGTIESGSVNMKECAASTVVGDHRFDEASTEVIVFKSHSAGGLVGSITDAKSKITIKESYADCYLVGEKAGGLVGESHGVVTLGSSYAAGFVTYQTEGAGLICGSADLEDCYTVLCKHDLSGDALMKPYYATAKNDSVIKGKVYYAAENMNLTDPALGEAIGTLTITEMKNSLGNDFESDTADSTAYNLMGQTLSSYTYPVLKALVHYGDWSAEFQVGALVYYEKYSDGTYGFYGANVESTLKDSADLTVVGDGYGIVYRKGKENLPKKVTVTVTGIGTETLAIESGKPYPVTDAKGEGYSIYPLPKELVNTERALDTYYLKAKITADQAETDYYYFNPHFAKTVVYLTDQTAAAPALTADSHISVRTARHLYMMSLYYDTYADVTAPVTFLQERNIGYQSYDWNGYSTKTGKLEMQAPIAGNEKAFQAVYDGQCNWITDVSFATETGLYVGFIGRNEGIIQNVVLRASYEENSDANFYVGRSGDIESNQAVSMGILAGRNEKDGLIRNCATAGYYIAGSDGTIHAYQNSYLYAGGLVGINSGIIESSEADTPMLRLSSNYANVSLGGFAGSNSGMISNSYALGHIEVAFARGGRVSVAGFAGSNSAVIRNSYCAVALTTSGITTTAYGFTPLGGSAVNCKYLNRGTYSYVNHMYSFNIRRGDGEEALFGELRVEKGSADAAKHSYDFQNTQTASGQYPFRAVVRDASGNLVHYGDWLDDEKMGTFGIFYWELEKEGTNDRYHFTYLGTEDGKAMGGTSLCNSHDDGGVITEYGYGYFEMNQGSVTELTLENAVINGRKSFKSSDKDALYNKEASEALAEQMNLTLGDGTKATYTFYAFTTRTKAQAKAANDGKGYLCMDGNNANSTWTLTYHLASGEGTQMKTTYTVSPFFANAMQCEGGKTIIAADGSSTDYTREPGSEENPYEIRSIEQLQFINWNWKEQSTSKLVDQNNYKNFPYLMYANTIGQMKVTKKEDITDGVIRDWRQSHDVDGTNFSGYTPIAGNYESTSKDSYQAFLYAWFGGSYNGESYKIQNVKIESNSFAVGLFGTTVGANIKNIIMYSDRDTVIQRKETTAYQDKAGAYSIGGLIGVAYDYNVENTDNHIQNCAIAGYKIQDSSSNQQGLGEANVGGLIGVANVHLRNCSAVIDLVIDATHANGTARWGIFIRAGGLAGAAQGRIENCYSGGSGSVTQKTLDEFPNYTNDSDQKMEIYIGGIIGSAFTSNYYNFTGEAVVFDGSPTVQNCYTYFRFPEEHAKIQAMFCIGSLSDRVNNAAAGKKVTITNCYYLDQIQTVGVTDIYNGTKLNRTDGFPTKLTYAQMSDFETGDGLLKRLNGQENSGTNPLNYGAGYSNVTTTEGSANVAIDGKYSYPGNNVSLEGKNYPFPAVIQQKDLTFSTEAKPVYVYVHYGDWSVDGPYWESGRDSMDIFQDMNTEGEYSGYATKTFWLNSNGTSIETLTENSFTLNPPIAQVVAIGPVEDGRYPVTIKAVNTGTTIVKVAAAGYEAEFTLEVTADIELTADPERLILSEREEDKTGVLYFKASSVTDADHTTAKQYETADAAAWTVSADREVLTLEQEDTGSRKNCWSVTRDGMGKVTLAVTFTYDYHTDENPGSVFQKVLYVDVLQPDIIGLSDGRVYNVAYLGADAEGTNTSYSFDKPSAAEGEFFLYLDSEKKKLSDMTVWRIQVGEIEALFDAEAGIYKAGESEGQGYYSIELDTDVTADSIYEYLTGKMCYYLTDKTDPASKYNVPLTIVIKDKEKHTYTLSITIPEVRTVSPGEEESF